MRVPSKSGAPHHQEEVREFAITRRLLRLGDWLASLELGPVGIEATGVYWKPVYYLLDDDFEL